MARSPCPPTETILEVRDRLIEIRALGRELLPDDATGRLDGAVAMIEAGVRAVEGGRAEAVVTPTADDGATAARHVGHAARLAAAATRLPVDAIASRGPELEERLLTIERAGANAREGFLERVDEALAAAANPRPARPAELKQVVLLAQRQYRALIVELLDELQATAETFRRVVEPSSRGASARQRTAQASESHSEMVRKLLWRIVGAVCSLSTPAATNPPARAPAPGRRSRESQR